MKLYFWSGDPGFANLGFTTGYANIDHKIKSVQVVREQNATIPLVQLEDCPIEKLVPAIENAIGNCVKPEWYENEFIGITEAQYLINPQNSTELKLWYISAKLNMIETAIYTVLHSTWKRDVQRVNSSSYKSELKIRCPKGTKNPNDANKKLAHSFAMNLVGNNEEFSHHVADAINQLFFVLRKRFPGYQIKFF